MYTKLAKKTIAKKRYYFKKGYLQVPHGKSSLVRDQLMEAIGTTSQSYFYLILRTGILNISLVRYDLINDIFRQYGITDVWDVEDL